MKIKVSNDKELAEAAIKLSGYTKAELKKEYKKSGSPSYKRGFWSSRGIQYGLGLLIEKLLF